MSLEYSMFRFADDYPTAEGLSEMIMQVCMDEHGTDVHGEIVKRLVDAAWFMRCVESMKATGEDDPDIPNVRDPGSLFMEQYAKACKRMGEPCEDGDAWWEDWWPTDCLWHRSDVVRLARLKAGETKTVRRQLRAAFAKHKENDNAVS